MDQVQLGHEAQFYRLLRRAVFTPLLFALALAAFFLWQVQRLRLAFSWVDRSNRVISQAHVVEKLLIDAQSGARGYLLMGELKFLEPFNHAKSAVHGETRELEQLIADNPNQVALTREALRLVEVWFNEADQNIAIRDRLGTAGFDPHSETLAQSAPVMLQIREHFERLVDIEEKFRDKRVNEEESTARLAILSGLSFATLLALVLAVLTRRLLFRLGRGYQTAIDKLSESREWFQTTLTSIGDAVMVVDTQARVEFLNPVAEELTGWTYSEATGRPMREIFHIISQETRALAVNPVERVIKEGKLVGLANHTVLIARNGKERPIEDSAAPICDESGRVRGVVLVFRDVSAKYLAQAVLQESESRFQALANAAPVLIWTSASDQHFDWFNEEWLKFRGRSQVEDFGKGWLEGIHPEDLSRYLEVYSASFEARTPFELEYRLKRFDGMYRWLLVRGVPRRDSVGRFMGYIGSCTDITERRESRIQLESLASSLRSAVQVRDEFLSVASHELKTPLTTLKLQLQMTERTFKRPHREPPTVEKFARTITTCLDQTDRLAALVDDLLDVTRIQAGKLTYTMEDVDLAQAASRSVERLSELADSASSRLTVIAPEPVVAHCDPFRIDQVFTNLITNAIKYGDGEPVEVEVRHEGLFAQIMVRDHGIGIAPENQQMIFERFARAVGSNNISGLGLGLFIVRQIVEAHHGKVEVASELGLGSTFTVTLPCSAPA